jgi:hypothetical protein
MTEPNLPLHVLDRVERRWASRLARDAVAWRSEKPKLSHQQAVLDRAGRVVPVAIKRAPPAIGRIA